MPPKVASVEIYGQEVKPQVGSYVVRDGAMIGDKLLAGDDGAGSWQGSQFRYPVSVCGPIKDVAVNVRVTGRTLQRVNSGYGVKVEFEWVGDGEPSTYSRGWLMVD